MSYVPRPTGLAGRVCAFFLNHRDEELEEQDVAAKFTCPPASVRPSLRSAVAMGYLAYGPDETSTNVYKAGPRLGELQEEPAAGAPATLAEASTSKGKKKAAALPPPRGRSHRAGHPHPHGSVESQRRLARDLRPHAAR